MPSTKAAIAAKACSWISGAAANSGARDILKPARHEAKIDVMSIYINLSTVKFIRKARPKTHHGRTLEPGHDGSFSFREP
jgi:hypothetical protein